MGEISLIDFFGDYPKVRIGCLLLENPEREYTMHQIMEETKGDSDIYALIDDLVEDGYIKKSEDTYRINLENGLIKKLLGADCGNGSGSHK